MDIAFSHLFWKQSICISVITLIYSHFSQAMASKQKKVKTKSVPLSIKDRIINYWREKSPILRFALSFIVLMVLFYIIYTIPMVEQMIILPVVHFQAEVSGNIINLLGYAASCEGTVISGNGVSLEVAKGCDGFETLVLFIIGIVLVPFAWRSKLYGMGIGVLALFVLNLVRIIGLFFVQKFYPASFESMHVHGGFVLFTIFTIMIWLVWVNWAIKRQKTIPYVVN